MCGRYTLQATPIELADAFALMFRPNWSARYNIAPTQLVPIIRQRESASERSWDEVHWGLIPSWSRDRTRAASMINARSETAAEKPSFREPFHRQRCLIPANGFYEWEAVDKKTKQPYLIACDDRPLFAFAGLWERWTGPEQESVETCTILTTSADDELKHLHERMPIILDPERYSDWLDPDIQETAKIQELLSRLKKPEWSIRPVSTAVNSARNEGPICIQPPRDRLFPI